MGTNPYEKKETKVKWYRTFKFKVISIVTAFILMVSVGVVAVIAATQQNAKIQTKISFHATGVSANVYVSATHYGTDGMGNYDASYTYRIPASAMSGSGWVDHGYGKHYVINTKTETVPALSIPEQRLGEVGGALDREIPIAGSDLTTAINYVSYIVYRIDFENLGDRLVRVSFPTLVSGDNIRLMVGDETMGKDYLDLGSGGNSGSLGFLTFMLIVLDPAKDVASFNVDLPITLTAID